MGDAFSRPFLEDSEMGIVSPDTIKHQSNRNTFLYTLYRLVLDPTDAHKKESVLKYAGILESGWPSKYAHLHSDVKTVIPLLVKEDEYGWIRLLAWVGRYDHMFYMFKDVSPFAGKQICHIGAGRLLKDSLPDVSRLWEPDSWIQNSNRMVVILPADVKLSYFGLGNP